MVDMGDEETVEVLLVEDSPTDAFLTREAIKQSSLFRLTHVQTLGEAMKLLAELDFSVVLLDLGLPDSQGLKTLAKLRQQHSSVPVIVLTALDDEELAIKSAHDGAQEYLVKSDLQDGNLRRTIRHVIERDRSEQALRKSQQQLRAIIDTAPQCIKLLSPDGTVLEMNVGGLHMVEADKPDDVIGKNIFPFIAPEYREDFRAFYEGVCQGQRGTMDFEIVGLNGTRHHLKSVAVPFRNLDGSTLCLSIAQDVSAQSKVEQELRLRDRAIQAVSQGILITDASQPDNPIVFASPGFEQITGYTSQEAIGKNCRFLQGQDTDPAAIAKLREAIRELSPCSVELLNYRKDGTPFWNSVSITPIFDHGGMVNRFVGVLTNVSVRRDLEDQLRHSQKLEAVGQLAGGIAHDFNNLLTIIIGYCEAVQSTESLTESGQTMSGEITQAAYRAAGLTRQLLAFSRKQVLEPVILSLNELVGNLNKMLLRLITEDIELECRLAPAVWPVRLDPGQIEQVIVNLVVNARDAMPKGGRLTIESSNVEWSREDCRTISDREPGQYVKIMVSDTGSGLAPEIKARMFEPFFTTKEAGKGTGLGLAVVHGIVKQSDGHIDVISEVGVGTSMICYFPAVNKSASSVHLDKNYALEKRGSETILLIEDEEGVRRLARLALEKQGYTILEASNGRRALETADSYKGLLHLIVTDVVMPVMGGREVVERLLLRFPHLKVLYMTGYTDDAILLHGINHNSHALLQKPFSPSDLSRKVRSVLDADY
jgi:two-component system, cell cycle sensor histidine kinase and response regulator CckA